MEFSLGHQYIWLMIVFIWVSSASAERCGKISSLKGKVEVLRLKSESQPQGSRFAQKAKKRMHLLCSDIVVTHQASRAKLRLKKALMTMGPNSRLEVAAESKSTGEQSLSLPYGKVRSFFKGKNTKGQASRFKVKTPAAVVGVRGTDFYVSYKPNQKVTEQATLTGKVEVVQKATNVKVEVEKGQQVKVDNYKAKLEEELKREKEKLEKQKAEQLAKLEKQKLDEEAKKKLLKELEEKAKQEQLAKQKALEESLKLKADEKTTVAEIEGTLAKDIRETSLLVQNDKEFTTKAAVEVLGAPETWLPPENEEIPYLRARAFRSP